MTDGTVLTCLADNCSYNCEKMCCAPEIMVGDSHPACDMFTTASVQTRDQASHVQQCLVGSCHFNEQQSCAASGVTMMPHTDHADCGTYRM